MKNTSIVSKCYSIHQLQYVQRKLETMIYPICDWDSQTYQHITEILNKTFGYQMAKVFDHVAINEDFKSLVHDQINSTLHKFLGWYDSIKILPYYTSEYVKSDVVKPVEYPSDDSFTVQSMWHWTHFNIANLNWIHFLLFLIQEETGETIDTDKVYNDIHYLYARLVSLANIIDDIRLIKYSTDMHLRTFCIKPPGSTVYAVMNMFSKFDNGYGHYQTLDRQAFEDDLNQLYTKFMEK